MENIKVNRRDTKFSSDPSRVINKFYYPGNARRAENIINRVLSLSNYSVTKLLEQILSNFDHRHRNLKEVFNQMMEFNKVLDVIEIKKEKLPKEILDLIIKREGYRKRGDFEAADKIRKELNEKGYWVEDSPEGPRWKKVK